MHRPSCFTRTALLALFIAAGGGAHALAEGNPFFKPFDTPFGVPPFDQIRTEHYLPAFKQALADHKAEVEGIANNPQPPTFENTVLALERSGAFLDLVASCFDVLNSSMTSDAMRQVADEMAPARTRHVDDILMNATLFGRVRKLWETRETLGLEAEDMRLLERTYKAFRRGGASLEGDAKERMRRINEELAQLTLRYGNNILAENNRFVLALDQKDLDGLPAGAIEAAAEAARARGLAGKWVFTLHKPSLIPFLQYSTRRDLRERMFRGYIERGNHDDELDNKAIASRIAGLRAEKAKLLGFPTYAAWVLDDAMAKTPDGALGLLNRLWPPALAVAKREAAEYRAMVERDGGGFALAPWDWFHYATRVQKERYALDDEALRPYFKLENVVDGAFGVATRLWGVRFAERHDVPRYHPDVRVFDVTEADGGHLGILYVDYFPRESKRGGAWMNAFRGESIVAGKRVPPIVTNNGNFTRPTADKPSLLTLEEVQTLFHEFGHALHELLSKGRYESLSGTNVATDFVELPSQIMENWATAPEVLALYARHFQTNQPIPAELVERIHKAKLFNQGFATTEYLAASFLDLDYHMLTEPHGPSIPLFERESMEALKLIPEIVPRYRSTYFNHIFASAGYAAGYYSYIWAEVLDADAFEAFKEKGLFDRETAAAFRRHILERGNSEEPMELYKKFRGDEPKVEPLLRRRGLM